MYILKYDPIISYYSVHTNKRYSLDMTKYYRSDDGVLRTGFDQATSINCNRRVGGTFNETKQNKWHFWLNGELVNHDIT